VLAETLADDAMAQRGWPLERALDLARHVLLDNPRRIFARNPEPAPEPEPEPA
jgi:glucuronate isomerase